MPHLIRRRKIPSPRPEWEAREVLRDIGQQPHLFTRIKLNGDYFPHRSLVPFVKVGSALTVSVEIADDSLSVRAYFAEPLPPTGIVEFGYGDEVVMRFPRKFSHNDIQLLDHERLPRNVRLPSDSSKV